MEIKVIKDLKHTILFEVEGNKYFIRKDDGLIGQYSTLENGKKWYQYTLDFTDDEGQEIQEQLLM